ncbi:class I fructose-bisphosphate aldolase [Pseudomonas sp.]|uniref:class I fructose-bisphosphate aldolase n=1 Tax=Pseudomonas sp. TaxID=306 RepID=UPI002586555C|nr:class I fructose-bisphosphate aldolase [Pseudomonas sp.]
MPLNADTLIDTAQALMAPGKGILAMDESLGTCNRRFAQVGIDPTEENRRRYRELLVTTPGLAAHISGAILFEETLYQHTAGGVAFPEVLRDAGIVVGIKVDAGAQPLAAFPGERITEGLDGLRERLKAYAAQGARFAKWRAVLTITEQLPSGFAIHANAQALARYAALCQEAGIVPIVEPEILMDGDHSLARCQAVTSEVLQHVFEQLHQHRVLLEGMILKPNMVLPGQDSAVTAPLEAVAQATVDCFRRKVPAAVAGIAFLSGGQSSTLATAHLNAMHQGAPLPWPLTFSYGRALQDDALHLWAGDDNQVEAAQRALVQRARCNGAAAQGHYHPSMEQ